VRRSGGQICHQVVVGTNLAPTLRIVMALVIKIVDVFVCDVYILYDENNNNKYISTSLPDNKVKHK
jgi:hypothetical protein